MIFYFTRISRIEKINENLFYIAYYLVDQNHGSIENSIQSGFPYLWEMKCLFKNLVNEDRDLTMGPATGF